MVTIFKNWTGTIWFNIDGNYWHWRKVALLLFDQKMFITLTSSCFHCLTLNKCQSFQAHKSVLKRAQVLVSYLEHLVQYLVKSSETSASSAHENIQSSDNENTSKQQVSLFIIFFFYENILMASFLFYFALAGESSNLCFKNNHWKRWSNDVRQRPNNGCW